MARPIAPDYGQQFLLPPALEDWVGADHPVRFVREFVDQLNLPALGFSADASEAGRPPYATSLLVKIWLHGYYHRIRSTRKLEAACRDHLPLMWLTGLIVPDHNSLWRFWRDNKSALRNIFKQTVQVALHTGAVGLAVQALDGTKIEAAASGYSGWSKEYMEKLLTQLDAVLDRTELQVVQENADLEKPGYRLPVGLSQGQALREEIKKGLAQLAADGREHYHPVEPEARRMKLANKTNRFGYNAQVLADGQEGIILANDVSRNETDSGQLTPMIQAAQQNVGAAVLSTTTLADTGYGSGADLQAAAEKQMDVLAPPAEGKPAKDNPYAAKHFHYNPADRTVTCPRGEKLDYEGQTQKRGELVQRYRCHCRNCPMRTQCTRDPKGRQIEVWSHTPMVQAMRARLKLPAQADMFKRRAEIIERPIGQIKQHDGFRRWTVWGLENVRVQWSMLCTAFNLRILYRRWIGRGKDIWPAIQALIALPMRSASQIMTLLQKPTIYYLLQPCLNNSLNF